LSNQILTALLTLEAGWLADDIVCHSVLPWCCRSQADVKGGKEVGNGIIVSIMR